MARIGVLRAVSEERDRQEALKAAGKFANTCADVNALSATECLAVLGEEFGEVSRVVCESIGQGRGLDVGHLMEELVQVAAVCVAWVEQLDVVIDGLGGCQCEPTCDIVDGERECMREEPASDFEFATIDHGSRWESDLGGADLETRDTEPAPAPAPELREVHVMIDLETLSTSKNAAILQLAAVSFDPVTGEILSRFNRYISEHDGADVRLCTVAWWMQQNAAKDLGFKIEEHGCSIATALSDFEAWLGPHAAVWAHGMSFDLPVLSSAYRRLGKDQPWSYRTERDTRTLYALAPGGMPAVTVDENRKHDALYDCEVQVAQVVCALATLRVRSSISDALASCGG